jgi:hypothetical protein
MLIELTCQFIRWFLSAFTLAGAMVVRRRAAAGIEAIDGGGQKSLRVAPTIGAGITTACWALA